MKDATHAVPLDDGETKYNAARYWDYILGGYHNFAVDRKVGDWVIQSVPDARLGALANRSFERRVVRWLTREGISQFVDLGSGLPTVGPVHEIAQSINPKARTLYVDNDPVAVIHSRSILEGNPNARVLQEDIRNIDQILDHLGTDDWIDLHQPIGLLLVSVMHFVKDDTEAHEMMRKLRQRLASGSYVVISHYSLEGAPESTISESQSHLFIQ